MNQNQYVESDTWDSAFQSCELFKNLRIKQNLKQNASISIEEFDEDPFDSIVNDADQCIEVEHHTDKSNLLANQLIKSISQTHDKDQMLLHLQQLVLNLPWFCS